MKMIPRQKIWLTIVVVTNLLLWLIPSDVVEQIARDRQTMLGRYSRTHFAWIVAVAIISMVTLYIDWSTGETYKKRAFRVIASLFVLIPALGIVDFLMRTKERLHYRFESLAYHRPVNDEFHQTFVDKPEAYRTYPDAPPGYGTVECVLHTDARGYRNQTALDQYDIVVLGDSFAEGSSVSDEHAWPRRLASSRAWTVYNLGMSGYDPYHYLESLRETGLSLKPKVVLCQLYEGNDFRSAKSDKKRRHPSLSKRIEKYFDRSPLINGLDRLLIQTFAPINSEGPVPGSEILDWLPLAIPDGPDARYYAFAPKQLRDMFQSRERFAQHKHWLNPRRQLQTMHELCAEAGCEFVVMYAPTKAHVTMPIVADRLPPEHVRAFLKLRYKKELPGPEKFLPELVERADAREQVVQRWCQRESIPFFSFTPPLRKATQAGTQTYYTYDQHWTPDGHAVVADAVGRYLAEKFLAPEPPPAQAAAVRP